MAEISETLSLYIQGRVLSGLGLENCSYPTLSFGVSLDHQHFPSFSLETETDF